MNDLWIIGIVVVLVISGWFIYPFAKKKGWIKDGSLDGADKAIDIARMILLVLNIDEVTRNRTKFLLDMADAAVNYIMGLSDSSADKKTLSLETINHVLSKLRVTPTPEEQALIERLVEEVLYLHQK